MALDAGTVSKLVVIRGPDGNERIADKLDQIASIMAQILHSYIQKLVKNFDKPFIAESFLIVHSLETRELLEVLQR